ncbi:MAG: DNA replication protein DnaD [Pelotomaculum sp. PtaB.Bin104]|nr:MAG: DNA replication protein DnaD [Pelotomaculum sp. PtaB.Bin104]
MSQLWLRLYTEIRHERKLRRLPPAQRWLWVVILTLAKESPQQGWLLISEGVPVTLDDLADEAAIPFEDVEAGVNSFVEQKMLENIEGTWHLVNWDKRQYVSDSSAERVRRHRAKQQENGVTSIKDVTLQKRYSNDYVTPPETEIRDQRSETDINDHDNDDRAREREEEIQPDFGKMVSTFEQEFGRPLSPLEVEQIQQWESEHDPLLVLEALKRAILGGKYNFKYINSILLEWSKNHILTVPDIKAYDEQFRARKERKGGQPRAPDSKRNKPISDWDEEKFYTTRPDT